MILQTLASTDKSTLRYSPEDQHKQLHSRDNLKYHTIKFVRHYKAEVFLWQTTDKSSNTKIRKAVPMVGLILFAQLI
jgi:hypothetical protein